MCLRSIFRKNTTDEFNDAGLIAHKDPHAKASLRKIYWADNSNRTVCIQEVLSGDNGIALLAQIRNTLNLIKNITKADIHRKGYIITMYPVHMILADDGDNIHQEPDEIKYTHLKQVINDGNTALFKVDSANKPHTLRK